MQNRQSRLSRNVEKQSKKQLIIFLVGIFVICLLVLKYGTVAIQTIGNISGRFNQNSNTTIQQVPSLDTLDPPYLTQIPTATKTSSISISGITSTIGGTAQLYINNQQVDTVNVDGKAFTFTNETLSVGDNDIKVRQKVNNKLSSFSRDYHVSYANQPPKLNVSFPNDGMTFSRGDQEIDIKGETDPNDSVTVNSFVAIVNDDGSFTYHMTLNPGDNDIKVEATNPSGLTTNKEFHVTYNP